MYVDKAFGTCCRRRTLSCSGYTWRMCRRRGSTSASRWSHLQAPKTQFSRTLLPAWHREQLSSCFKEHLADAQEAWLDSRFPLVMMNERPPSKTKCDVSSPVYLFLGGDILLLLLLLLQDRIPDVNERPSTVSIGAALTPVWQAECVVHSVVIAGILMNCRIHCKPPPAS